jgi:hypothetical protein
MKEVLKEAYEVPRITVRGIVLEGGIALESIKTGTITQDDWTGSVEEVVGEGADPDGNISLVY